MALGRPPKYKKIYCKQAKEHLAKGFSIKSLAGLFDIVPGTIQHWKDSHPDFLSSIKKGRSLGEQFYLKKAHGLVDGNKGSSDMLKFLMKNLYQFSENPNATENESKININFNKID